LVRLQGKDSNLDDRIRSALRPTARKPFQDESVAPGAPYSHCHSRKRSTIVRKVLVLFATASVTAAITVTAAAQRSAPRALNGTVGPGFTITLQQNGKIVKTLKPGTYKLVIADKAAIHAFSLNGPHGYAKDFTTVPFVGTKTFTIKLVAGKYMYYCPPHQSMMFGYFTVK
jgi:plastocyanin